MSNHSYEDYGFRWPVACPSGTHAKEPENDEDIDLFGSDDEEDEEKAKIVQERLKVLP